MIACLQIAVAMRDRGERGSIVSLLCDRGERYDETLFDPAWLAGHRFDLEPGRCALRAQLAGGTVNHVRGKS
jgi:cysteine synthase A